MAGAAVQGFATGSKGQRRTWPLASGPCASSHPSATHSVYKILRLQEKNIYVHTYIYSNISRYYLCFSKCVAHQTAEVSGSGRAHVVLGLCGPEARRGAAPAAGRRDRLAASAGAGR